MRLMEEIAQVVEYIEKGLELLLNGEVRYEEETETLRVTIYWDGDDIRIRISSIPLRERK